MDDIIQEANKTLESLGLGLLQYRKRSEKSEAILIKHLNIPILVLKKFPPPLHPLTFSLFLFCPAMTFYSLQYLLQDLLSGTVKFTMPHKSMETIVQRSICISLAIWFSSSLLRLTRLVRFISRVCCHRREETGKRGEKRTNVQWAWEPVSCGGQSINTYFKDSLGTCYGATVLGAN